MKRWLAAVAGMGCILSTASFAHAQMKQEFGEQGEFIIGADRLVPLLSWSRYSVDEPTGPGVSSMTGSSNQTSFSLLFGSTEDPADQFYTVPRVGFDYVVVPNVTVGGDFMLLFTSGSSSTETDNTNGTSSQANQSSPSLTGFGIAPRGGYILRLNEIVSLWFRGGFSYYQTSTSDSNDHTTNSVQQWAFDLEPQAVFTVIPHVGFTGAVNLDIPFGGSTSVETDINGISNKTSAFSSIAYLGATVGMLAYF